MKTIKKFILNMKDIENAVRDYISMEYCVNNIDDAKVTFKYCDLDGKEVNAIDENGRPISVNVICTVTEDD